MLQIFLDIFRKILANLGRLAEMVVSQSLKIQTLTLSWMTMLSRKREMLKKGTGRFTRRVIRHCTSRTVSSHWTSTWEGRQSRTFQSQSRFTLISTEASSLRDTGETCQRTLLLSRAVTPTFTWPPLTSTRSKCPMTIPFSHTTHSHPTSYVARSIIFSTLLARINLTSGASQSSTTPSSASLKSSRALKTERQEISTNTWPRPTTTK